MRREVPGVPNGILSCPVLPMPLALVTFGGSPISVSEMEEVSNAIFQHTKSHKSNSIFRSISGALHLYPDFRRSPHVYVGSLSWPVSIYWRTWDF